jgi:hypothetical protein
MQGWFIRRGFDVLTDLNRAFVDERRLPMSTTISNKTVGPFMFLLSVVLVSSLWAAFEHLKMKLGGSVSPIIFDCGFSILGMLWTRVVEGRLRDAGLPRWYMWPYIVTLSLGCILLLICKVLDGPKVLGLFVVMQVPTVFIKSRTSIPNLS